jgi:hypothetical protein
VSFDDTGNLTLDLGFGGALYAATWTSNAFPSASGSCDCGRGYLVFSGASHALVRVTKGTSLQDIAGQVNQSEEFRATVVENLDGYRLVVANVSHSPEILPNGGHNAFDDTGNLTIPSGVRRVTQRGVQLGGQWAAATMVSTVVSTPVRSPAARGTAGSGVLRLGYNRHQIAVRISRGMSLYHVAAAINRTYSVFHARIRSSAAGVQLEINAIAPESRDLYGFDDTGSLTIPGMSVGFDDTGNLTISGGWTNFDDTGNLTVSGGNVDFDDTGNLTVPRGDFSVDDHGNIKLASGTVDFDDTGNLTISVSGLFG